MALAMDDRPAKSSVVFNHSFGELSCAAEVDKFTIPVPLWSTQPGKPRHLFSLVPEFVSQYEKTRVKKP